MNKLGHFFETEAGQRLKNVIICFGASVVMIGAMGKLEHWAIGSYCIIAGLSTEAFIFFLLGIIPPNKEYHWEKIYPELNIPPTEEELIVAHKIALHSPLTPPSPNVTQQLDKMLSESNVAPELIRRLGDNLSKLGDNIGKLSDITDSGIASNEFSSKAKEAAGALSEMKSAYNQATDAANQLTMASEATKGYHQQVQDVTKNLSQLNAIYELELQDTNNHLKAMNNFYGSLSKAMMNLQDSVEDTNKYREQMSGLAKNLSSLNSIYGNMLAAMAMGVRNTNQ
jgi:gliding motility-associated protein GldL